MKQDLPAHDLNFLSNDGDLGVLIQSHDWSRSLGAPETWPESLRSVVGLMLGSRSPMGLVWGPNLTCLYNDAYRPILGSKHPSALGAPLREVWSEIWGDIAQLVDQSLAGDSIYFEDLPLTLERNGYKEQTWFTFSSSPVRDEAGRVAGLFGVFTETTRKVFAQRHLAVENERMFELFQQAPGFMAVVREPNHIFDLANEAFLRLVGKRDLVGKPVREALPELKDQGFFELLDQVYRTGEPFIGDAVLIKLQRETDSPLEDRLVTFVYQPIRDGDRQATGIFVQGQDVTEFQRTYVELRRNKLHLARAQEVAALGSWELDVPTGKLTWSEETYRIYGLDAEEFEPTFEAVMGRIHDEDKPRAKAHFERLLLAGAPYEISAQFERGDGEFRWGIFAASCLRDEQGSPTTIIGTIQDITERRSAEDALRSSERQARAVIDASPDAFIRLDRNGLVTEWNPQAESLFGWSREEALGQFLSEMIMPEEARSAHAEGLKRYRNATPRLHLNRRIGLEAINRDGDPIPVELTIVSTWHDDEVVFNGFVRDLRESIEVEKRLRQAQKMEAVGLLTGGVAHDFNNLLAIAIGNLDLLEEEARLDSDANELLDSAREACLRGADLTGRLLAFARQQTLRPRSTDLGALIAEYVKLLKRLLGADIELRVEQAEGLWNALVDPRQLEEAITNLATNARDAMPDGGSLTISTRNETIDATNAATHLETPGEYVAVEVTDSGQGMTAEDQARAIEPFFTTKEIGKGTGLGLSMVFGFMKQSAGHLRVYSEIGRGTTVTLLLPRAQDSEEEEAPAELSVPQSKPGETVLLVDDNESLRRLAAKQLTSLGYNVLEAEDGPSALRALSAEPKVDLLLTDIIMPGGLSGVDLGREARQIRPELKLIYMSGFPEAAFGDRAHLESDVVLLRKPFRRQVLATSVRQTLDAPQES